MEFEILKKSKKSRARLGFIKTSHGVIETPSFVPVATQATIKTLTFAEAEAVGSQILIANTYHLHLRPGENIVKHHGGLHKFMNWNKPLMTDSGGYQVFSLGFGKDFGVGKIMNNNASAYVNNNVAVISGQQPANLKIMENGVFFRSHIDGKKIFLNPTRSIKIQESLGADIIFAFDECPPPNADYQYNKKAMERTHRWAVESLGAKSSKLKAQGLFGIVQGGKFKDLRQASAKFISSLPFDGFGIGGEFGNSKKEMAKMIGWVNSELPESKPRHLLGIGQLEDIVKIIKEGVDTFDCTIPTHYARHGTAFTSKGRLNLNQSIFLTSLAKGKNSLDKNCGCFVCQHYTRAYICHLLKAREITALRLITFHNLYFFNAFVANVRKEIKKGKI